MALDSKTLHRVIDNPALPYRTYMSPTYKGPCYTSGSADVMTSLAQIAEKRPGFATAIEGTASTFTALKRMWLWQRWNGSYFAMFCDVSGGVAKVYKYEIGVDTSAALIWTSSTSTPFDAVVAKNAFKFGNGTDMKQYLGSGTTVYNWGISKPSAVPTLATGGTGIDAASGYYYRTTFYSSTTGQESSPSDASACSSIFSNKTVTVTLNATTTDAQVTHWNLYRTTDGGSYDPTLMKRVAQIAIGTTTYADSTADASLGTTVAPALLRNDPPPASTCFAFSQGRIAMRDATNINRVWLTGLDEIASGVPVDCVPSGLDGNYWDFDKEVTGIAPTQSGFAIFTPSRIYALDGDTLDSIRRTMIVAKRGAKSHPAIAALGNTVVWLDTASQVWSSDDGEIGEPIRTSIKTIDHTQAQIAIHISGEYHWVLLCDGANGICYVYDLDTKQWMPPWNNGAKAISSGETASGTTDLLIGRNGTKVLKMSPTDYRDDSSTYSGDLKTNLIDIHPDANPEWVGVVDKMSVNHNGQAPTVSQLNDEDVTQGNYTALTGQDPTHRQQGTYLQQTDYPSGSALSTSTLSSTARRVSMKMHWAASTTAFKVYSAKIQFHPVGA